MYISLPIEFLNDELKVLIVNYHLECLFLQLLVNSFPQFFEVFFLSLQSNTPADGLMALVIAF